MEINVGCTLRYQMASATGFVFQIEAAKADSQFVKSELLTIPAGPDPSGYTSFVDAITSTRKVRAMLGPGVAEINYRATVDVDTTGFDPNSVYEFDFVNLPMDSLEYVAPSRYCPSDTFTQFANEVFGGIQRGHVRIQAISDWVYSHIGYQSGATGPSSTAVDVFHSGQGVCRDFAHLGISLCRALGIPARYASVYADGLVPQDFHAVFQAYLNGPTGGRWFTFDPTRMSSSDFVVRIAAGRDAADVAFAWPQGEVAFEAPQVFVEAMGRQDRTRSSLAIGN
ncbi:transglutaminase family protein [Hyphomicrobium sp.]|jgi:transglutaminase-like putative cysteine protease|uniref:transglutaminase-like domain-containing protein n=1 Tax=Hyphomicrobium sp. TaxID=82 RepID=UPI00356A2EFE